MRLLGQIPHSKFRVTAYTLEHHYYVEIEAGPMKQCYKLHKDTTPGIEGIKRWLDEEFTKQIKHGFETMYQSHIDSINRNLKD